MPSLALSLLVFSFLHQFKILWVFFMLLIERNLLQPEDIQFLNIYSVSIYSVFMEYA